MRLVAHCLESRPRTEGADFGICQTFAASPAEPGELPCWFSRSALTLRAKVPNLNEATFAQMATDAEKNCPVSKVLKADIALDAKLV